MAPRAILLASQSVARVRLKPVKGATGVPTSHDEGSGSLGHDLVALRQVRVSGINGMSGARRPFFRLSLLSLSYNIPAFALFFALQLIMHMSACTMSPASRAVVCGILCRPKAW